MRRLLRPVLVVVALAVAATACSSDDPVTETSATPTAVEGSTAAVGTTVTIEDFAFSPPALRANAGDRITVTNEDGVVHTLTAEDRSFDTGNLAPSQSATVELPRAGTFSYFCDIHQYMKGQITVS